MHRRHFLASLPCFAAARSVLAATGAEHGSLGICTFSCHRHWEAARTKSAPTRFTDGPGFYDYAREIGADGTQVSVASLSNEAATAFRAQVDKTGGYYEGDVKLPKEEADLARFEEEVRRTRLAGATVARSVLSGTRRYETWKTLAEFREFRALASRRLAMVAPILQRHGLMLAIENHKDLTAEELAQLMREFSSEWIGVNVDTGNNLALLEDPDATVAALAPFALSVHLKDMAVQPHAAGFQLSEVTCGAGFLDLPRIVATLLRANGALRFNLEMATRDPLLIPCLTDGYFTTFPEREATHLKAALARVNEQPPKLPPPTIAGKSLARQLADEEQNNRHSLEWMHRHLL